MRTFRTTAGSWVRTPLTAGSLTAILVVAITAFAFGLRLWNLDWEPLHVDELRQAQEVQAPLGEILRLANVSVGAPLDHLIGKALVTVAPATDFTQRLPSAFFGTASVALIGLILFRERRLLAAVLGPLFVAVNPLSVELSQYIRPYAMPITLVLATIAVYQHWHLGSRGWKTSIWFGVFASLALLSRPLMPVIALATLGLVALMKRTADVPITRPVKLVRSDPLALFVLPVTFLVAWIPNAYYAGRASAGLVVDCWRCNEWSRFADGVENFGEFGELAMRPVSLVLLLVALFALLVVPSVRRALRKTMFVWLPFLITAPALTFVYAMALRPGLFFAIRYLVFLPVGFAFFFAIALDAIVASVKRSSGMVRGVTGGLVLLLAVSTSLSMLSWTRWQSENQDLADWRSVADLIESVETTGDIIVTIDTRPFERDFRFGFIAAPRYYEGSLSQMTPNDVIANPSAALSANRYHFVLFVPKMAGDWGVPGAWTQVSFSEMIVLTTPTLVSDDDRIDAWWILAEQLRPDVAVRTQIAGVALEAKAGTGKYPWTDVLLEQAAAIDQLEYAEELLGEMEEGGL